MDSRNILVTVYITNYNYGKYIKRAIKSVLNQTMNNIELIIIDDGSTDNSKEVIEEYANEPVVSIIYQKNKGLNITNNVALKAAKGKYIVRLDADDFFEPTALEEMSSVLEKNPDIGLVFPDYYLVDPDENVLSEVKRHDFDNEVTILDQPAHGACTMIRVDSLNEVGGYDESYTCQDGYELWVKFVSKFKVTNINKALFSYRRHNNNLTNNEDRILSTRSKIKDAFVHKEEVNLPNVVGIIPVRANYNLSLEKFGESTFLGHKVQKLVDASKIKKVLVVSSDYDVEKYVSLNFADTVEFVKRPKRLERINVGLFDTLKYLFDQDYVKEIDSVLFASLNYPYVLSESLNDAINTLAIFKADSLLSVRPEENKFFRHTGEGMQTILQQDKFTKLEREALYKYTGGIMLTNVKTALKKGKIVHGNVGHIVIGEKAALNADSKFERMICQILLEKEKIEAVN